MTDNPSKTPWGKMTPEERIAIFTENETGDGELQSYDVDDGVWDHMIDRFFFADVAYRIKPEDEEFSLSEQFTMPEGIPNFLVTLTVKNGRPSVVEVENIKTHMVFTPND